MGEERKRRGWGWQVWMALAVLLGMLIAWRTTFGPQRYGGVLPVGVQTARVKRGTQQQKIQATGIVASQIGTQVKIGSQITGRIRALPADVGTRIEAGQVVAVLDAPDLQAQVDQQRHNVSVAEASLAQAQSRLQQAKETARYAREQTDAQIAEARAASRAAQARVDSAAATARLQPTQTRSQIQQARAALSTARSAQKQVEQTLVEQVQQAQAGVTEATAIAENARLLHTRQQQLLREGFIAAQDVDNSEAAHRQALARLESAKANVDIVRQRTRADLQAAQDRVLHAQADLDAAQAGVHQDEMREAELRSAREAQQQAEATLELRTANRGENRVKEMAGQEAQEAVRQAEASVRQARALLRYQLAQQDKTVIRSPIRGTVLSIAAQQGETVAAGLAAPTLITVADLERLEVRAYVDETDIGSVRVQMPAEVRVEAFPGRVFRGRVIKIASASTIKDNVVTYETTVAVTNAGELLRPDMTADVSLIVAKRPEVLLVPSEAVHRESDRSIVYVLHAERPEAERVEVRPVDPGFDDGTHTEIRSGLKEGETLVLAGLQRLGVRAPDAQTGGRRR